MSNIDEGFGRVCKKEFTRFLEISSSSAAEVKSLAYSAIDQKYWNQETAQLIQDKTEEVKALDLGLIRYVKQSQQSVNVRKC